MRRTPQGLETTALMEIGSRSEHLLFFLFLFFIYREAIYLRHSTVHVRYHGGCDGVPKWCVLHIIRLIKKGEVQHQNTAIPGLDTLPSSNVTKVMRFHKQRTERSETESNSHHTNWKLLRKLLTKGRQGQKQWSQSQQRVCWQTRCLRSPSYS